MTGGRCHGPNCTRPAKRELRRVLRRTLGSPDPRPWSYPSSLATLTDLARRGVECGTSCPRCGAMLRAEPDGGWTTLGAAYQQVTPPDPQVGFLGRAFHWLFGRTLVAEGGAMSDPDDELDSRPEYMPWSVQVARGYR